LGKKNKTNKNWYYLMPILFAVGIVPLIVYMRIQPLEGIASEYWVTRNSNMDFFSYWKMFWIVFTSSISLLLLFVKRRREQMEKKHIIYIPFAVLAIFIVLSTFLSEHLEVALIGFPDRYEGALVLLSYLFLFLSSYYFVNSKKEAWLVLGVLFVSAFIVSLIGLFQFYGKDFFRTDFGKMLILPQKYSHMAETLNFRFGPRTIYATMYNTNNVGSYMAMLFPLAFTLYFYAKNNLMRVGVYILTMLLYFNLLGSNSRAGYIGAFFAFSVLVILLRKKLMKNFIHTGILLTSLCIVFILINTASAGRITARAKDALDQISAIARGLRDPVEKEPVKDGEDFDLPTTNPSPNILKYAIDEGIIYIEEGESTLGIFRQEESILFFDQEKKAVGVQPLENSRTLRPLDARFSQYSFIMNRHAFRIYKNNEMVQSFFIRPKIVRANVEEETKNRSGFNTKMEYHFEAFDEIKAWGFEGKESFGSSRGYIWSRSIPMLRNTLLWGYGPDTYAIYFPQHDVEGKAAFLNSEERLVDKPHNLYLQLAINTGVLSLIAFLAMVGIYFFQSVQLYWRLSLNPLKKEGNKTLKSKPINPAINFNQPTVGLSVGLFSAVIGYLGTGFFNDSIVSVAPVFWVLFAMGISINEIVKESLLREV
jgi:hypothetical protein